MPPAQSATRCHQRGSCRPLPEAALASDFTFDSACVEPLVGHALGPEERWVLFFWGRMAPTLEFRPAVCIPKWVNPEGKLALLMSSSDSESLATTPPADNLEGRAGPARWDPVSVHFGEAATVWPRSCCALGVAQPQT